MKCEDFTQEKWKKLHIDIAAKVLLEEYQLAKKQYITYRRKMFGTDTYDHINLLDKVTAKLPLKLQKISKGSNNVTRWIHDLVKRIVNPSSDDEIKRLSLKVRVLRRIDLHKDPKFRILAARKKNKHILRTLLDKEVFREANLSHFLMILGASAAQFHRLIRTMGHKATAFLSDDRGENGGRIVMEGLTKDGKHPLIPETHPRYKAEMNYWGKVFPHAPRWAPWSNYHMSRIHAVVYTVRDEKGNDVLLLPIHVDPKNAIVALAEFFKLRKKGKDEHTALEYHDAMITSQDDYVGTGLYDLGCSLFIHQLQSAHSSGVFHSLTIEGSQLIRTSGTIIEDDARSWKMKKYMAP